MSNQRAVGGASHATEEVGGDNSEHDDDLDTMEADFPIAEKAAARATKEAKERKEQQRQENSLDSGPLKKPTAEGKAAAPKAGGKAAGGKGKMKAVGVNGETAAPTTNGKAAAPKGKGKAVAGAEPPGGFDIEHWVATHITRADAKAEPKRGSFVSKLHKRAEAAADQCGVYDFQPITKRARDAAGEMHDSAHKKY